MNLGLRKNLNIKFKDLPEEIDESEIDLANPEAMELAWKSIEWIFKDYKDTIKKI